MYVAGIHINTPNLLASRHFYPIHSQKSKIGLEFSVGHGLSRVLSSCLTCVLDHDNEAGGDIIRPH